MTKRRNRFVVAIVVVAATLATPVTAFAAMDATLSSSHARPGDIVFLLTDDHTGTWNYTLASSEDYQPIYLAPTRGNPTEACGGPSSKLLGRLEWRGNAGEVVFIVPSLPSGDYSLFMETADQCWRIGGGTGAGHGPLVLSIGILPADNQDAAARWTADSLAPSPPPVTRQPRTRPTGSSSLMPWLGIVGGCAVVLLVVWAAWSKARATKPGQHDRGRP